MTFFYSPASPPRHQRTKKSFVTTSNHLVLQKHKFTCHVRNWFDPVANNPEKYPGRTSPEQFRLFFLVDGNERNAVHDEIPLFYPSSSSSSSSRSFSLFFPLKTTRLRTMNFNGDAIKHFAGFHLYLQERKRKKRQNQRKDFDIKCINAQRQIARSEIITALINPRGSQRSRYMTGSQNNMPLRFFCLRTEEWYGSDWWCTLGIREIRL